MHESPTGGSVSATFQTADTTQTGLPPPGSIENELFTALSGGDQMLALNTTSASIAGERVGTGKFTDKLLCGDHVLQGDILTTRLNTHHATRRRDGTA